MIYTSQIEFTSFSTPSENMSYDETCIHRVMDAPGHRFFRLYEWPNQPGITLPSRQSCPDDLVTYPHAPRITGGGIVFHSPGDLTICCVASLKDPFFPKPLKSKMHFISSCFKSALLQLNIPVSFGSETFSKRSNLAFCHSYPNPYELFYGNEKVFGLSLKKMRHVFIIQGHLHLQSNLNSFSQLKPEYRPFLVHGICPPHAIIPALQDQLKIQFSSD